MQPRSTSTSEVIRQSLRRNGDLPEFGCIDRNPRGATHLWKGGVRLLDGDGKSYSRSFSMHVNVMYDFFDLRFICPVFGPTWANPVNPGCYQSLSPAFHSSKHSGLASLQAIASASRKVLRCCFAPASPNLKLGLSPSKLVISWFHVQLMDL